MTSIDWSLLQPVDVGGAFRQGYEHAQQNALQRQEVAYQQRERARTEGLRNALTGAINPTTGAIDYTAARRAYLGAGDASGAVQIDAAQRTQQAAVMANHAARVNFAGEIMQQHPVTDQASYTQVLGSLRQAGYDISDIPTTYDPNYVAQVQQAYTTLQRQQPGYTLDQGAVRFRGDGTVEARGDPRPPRYYPLAPGAHLQIDPAYQGAVPTPTAAPHPPAVGEVQQGYRFRGGNPADPNAWEPVAGGGAGQPQAQGTFPRQDGGAFDFSVRPAGR